MHNALTRNEIVVQIQAMNQNEPFSFEPFS
eukprot:COSAG05_NODE_5758_length_1095_cov_0.920683_2_plen_29_part_01